MTMRHSLITRTARLAVAALALLMTVSVAWADCTQDTPPTCAYVPLGATVQITPTAFYQPNPQCINVTNNNCPADIMVPFGSAAEWNQDQPYSFISAVNNGTYYSENGMICTSLTSCPPVNGACGSSSGGTFTSIPTTNLCSAGNASDVTGTGPWNWTCAGVNGGTDASCSATLQGSCQTGYTWYGACWYVSQIDGGTPTCNGVCNRHGGLNSAGASVNTGECYPIIMAMFGHNGLPLYSTGQGCINQMNPFTNDFWWEACPCNN